MDFAVKTSAPARTRTACAIVPIHEGGRLGAAAEAFDQASGGMIRRLRGKGDFRGKLGQTLLLTSPGNAVAAQRLLLVGCGKPGGYGIKAYRAAVAAACTALAGTRVKESVSYLGFNGVDGLDPYYIARHLAEQVRASIYRFDEQKSQPGPKAALKRIGLGVDKADQKTAQDGIRHGLAIATGMDLTRDLGNRSANLCTPTHLAKVAVALAKQHSSLSATILNETQMKKLGMGSLLSVTAGSEQPARFIILNYQGAKKKTPPVALIGKGITFDTGGISLKPPASMDEMKFDMGGAASVLGTMAAIAELAPPINLVVLVPTCENMPNGNATKPGDIVTSLSGKTIEVLNTDAEGRLILCDALTYAQQRFNPRCMIDVATLTGACVIALGHQFTGLFSNDEDLAGELYAAGKRAYDPAWRLPITEEFGETLKSNFADLANIGSREGSSSVAASFLGKFVEDIPWAHLDIAGTAWNSGKAKGSTGRPVPLLVDYLLSLIS
jgi:leucyl aminopeptidase